MGRSKLRIFLCDFVHRTIGAGNASFPLGVALLASHVTNVFSSEVEVKLFKFADKFLDAVKNNPPQIIGFSNYSWNNRLNDALFRNIKSKYPEIITVIGGPHMYNDPSFQSNYLQLRDYIDFIVMNQSQGEVGIVNLVRNILNNFDKEKSIEPIDMVSYYNKKERTLIKGVEKSRFDIKLVPSVYLNGWMDEFFSTSLIPLLKTTDGCPFTCSYCVDGANERKKVRKLDEDQVFSELEYIANHKDLQTKMIMLTDDNFGLFDRDILIAKKIRDLYHKTGYPNQVFVNWAKNSVGRVKEVAKIFKDFGSITVSFQSFNQDALENVRRKNIKFNEFKELQLYYNSNKIPSYTEMILGFPGETKESHIEGLRGLFELQVSNIINYSLQLFDGADLSRKESRDKFGLKSKFRLADQQFGNYDGEIVIEADEHVLATKTLTEDEILFFRPVHWLIQFCWSYDYYKPLLLYFLSEGINPIELIIFAVQQANSKDAPLEIRNLFNNFMIDTSQEWFDSYEELYSFYSQKDEYDKICKGSFGKLNFKYIARVLNECKNEFDDFMIKIAKKMLNGKDEELDNIHRYLTNRSFKPSEIYSLIGGHTVEFDYDFVEWAKKGFVESLQKFKIVKPVSIEFCVTDKQKSDLMILANRFENMADNKSVRKMFEYVRVKDLFYKPDYKDNSTHEIGIAA